MPQLLQTWIDSFDSFWPWRISCCSPWYGCSNLDRPSFDVKRTDLILRAVGQNMFFFCISFIGRALAKLGRVSAINLILSYLILPQILVLCTCVQCTVHCHDLRSNLDLVLFLQSGSGPTNNLDSTSIIVLRSAIN